MLGVVSLQAEENSVNVGADAFIQEMAGRMNPGPQHKILDAVIGKWTHTIRLWVSPDTPPQETTGTNINQWILDGRFVRQDVIGQGVRNTFRGLGMTGYDNLKREYTSHWFDNMNTAVMTATGQYNSATKTIHEKGSFNDPMTGELNKPFRTEWVLDSKNSYRYTMYLINPNGSEFKFMEIHYRRTK